MKIAFTTIGDKWDSRMDPRFGRAAWLLIYDEEKDELIPVDNRSISREAHGAGTKTAQKLVEFKPAILITGNGPGGNAARVLEKMGVKVFVGAQGMTVTEAYDACKANRLKTM
jgi:predicted Fe-Mo cluster-binding NifX family protein